MTELAKGMTGLGCMLDNIRLKIISDWAENINYSLIKISYYLYRILGFDPYIVQVSIRDEYAPASAVVRSNSRLCRYKIVFADGKDELFWELADRYGWCHASLYLEHEHRGRTYECCEIETAEELEAKLFLNDVNELYDKPQAGWEFKKYVDGDNDILQRTTCIPVGVQGTVYNLGAEKIHATTIEDSVNNLVSTVPYNGKDCGVST